MKPVRKPVRHSAMFSSDLDVFASQFPKTAERIRNELAALATRLAESEARAEGDAKRFAFCNAHKVFPVLGQDGGRWVMFVAITSAKRTAFFGATPAEAIDAAIAQEAEREAASAATRC